MGPIETNPFSYGSPLSPGTGIGRPDEIQLLLQMALSSQNTRISAPRRYGKTTLIEDLRAEAERQGLNTVRVDLYGVLSRVDVAVRLKHAYRNLRGPVRRYLEDLLRSIGLKANAGVGPASVEAEATATGSDDVDQLLIDLLDLPIRFHERTRARTLIIFDEFQDVLQAGDRVDAVIRSRIQHQRLAASYLFAGSHPGMLDELFGDRRRPLFDQARPVHLEPLGTLAVAEYVEELFKRTSRSAGRPLDALIGLADGHPQRVMMLAHHLWEQTPVGEHATEDAWDSAVEAVFRELQEQYERAWSAYEKHNELKVLDAVARGRSEILSATALNEMGVGKTTAARARDRLLHAGDLRRDGEGQLHFVDPLFAAWIQAGRRPPRRPRRRPPVPIEAGDTYSPFGMADGARASLGDLGRGYVEVGNGASTLRALRMIRVVVGRKGSGKTLWLRRQQASLMGEQSLYVAPADYSAPRTSQVVRIAEMYPRNLLTEAWSSIWRVAVLRTVISHLSSQRFGSAEIDAPDVLPTFRAPASFGSQVNAVLQEHGSTQRVLSNYLLRPEWDHVESELAVALRDAPPMYFFLDALDEEFRHAPAFWLAAQKGLYFRLMTLLADQRFAGRLHVNISMRDLSYTSMLASEHATRYVDNRYVQVLHWDEERVRDLLAEKIRGLPSEQLVSPERGSTVEGWLGLSSIQNPVRATVEPLDQYLLRHTRLLPRDIVVMGNALCRLAARARQSGVPAVEQPEIRRTVADMARLFGREQIAICSNQISAELMPAHASADGYSEIYTGTDNSRYGLAYVSAIEDSLRSALQKIRNDRFGGDQMAELRKRLDADLEDAPIGLAALWQNGLLGYVGDEGSPVFYGTREYDELHMPLDSEAFVLHPMAVYALGLRATD
jgi:hypothetical protein